MKLYYHKEFRSNTLIFEDLLFYLTYEPKFRIKFCGKIEAKKYQPTGKPKRLTDKQKAIYKNIININYPHLTTTI